MLVYVGILAGGATALNHFGASPAEVAENQELSYDQT